MNRYSTGIFTGQYKAKATIGADFLTVVTDWYGQRHVKFGSYHYFWHQSSSQMDHPQHAPTGGEDADDGDDRLLIFGWIILDFPPTN